MAVTVFTVFENVADTLQDKGFAQWTKEDHLRYFMSALRSICLIRPDAITEYGTITLADGVRQTCGTGRRRLLTLTHNTSGPPINFVTRESIQDFMVEDLYTQTAASTIYDYWFDDRDPDAFFVSPPATGSPEVNGLFAKEPAAVTLADIETTNFEATEAYLPAAEEWMLYRAWARDSERSPNNARAQQHLSTFFDLMGVKKQADMETSPKTEGHKK